MGGLETRVRGPQQRRRAGSPGEGQQGPLGRVMKDGWKTKVGVR